MPTASAISIDDGAATPVAHTFVPVSITPKNSVFKDKDSVTSAGQKELVLGFSPSSASRGTTRATLRFNMPVEQVVDGVTVVAYTARFQSDIVIPETMTQAQRDDFGAFIKNAFSDAVVQGMIQDLDPVY
jgi:hypothetical protein